MSDQLEAPVEVRRMAEQSLEQVKKSVDLFLGYLQRGTPADVIGGAELSERVFDYAKRNVATAFAFAQRLAQVKDFQDLASVQTEFVQAQMQAMAEQTKGLSETAAKALMESAKMLTKRDPSS